MHIVIPDEYQVAVARLKPAGVIVAIRVRQTLAADQS
jgi:hypothetical protein